MTQARKGQFGASRQYSPDRKKFNLQIGYTHQFSPHVIAIAKAS